MSRLYDDLEGRRALLTVKGFASSLEGTIRSADSTVVVFDEDGATDRIVVPWRSVVALSLRDAR